MITKKDIVQILGIGLLLTFLVLPSFWISELILQTTSLYSWLGSLSVYVFPICFLALGIIQGLIWQKQKHLTLSLWAVAFAMFSCFVFNQIFGNTMYYYQLCDRVGYSFCGLIVFIGAILTHGFLAWAGFKLAYYGEDNEKDK